MAAPRISEIYKGRSLFITGTTGFLGKVLLSKILFSLPSVERVYILIRGKRGASAQERWNKIAEVSIVMHCAATVKFNDSLRSSAGLNIEGTARVTQLCKDMRRLQCFLHCSTAYANCDKSTVEELVYDPPVTARALAETMKWMKDEAMDAMTPALIGQKVNTYCLTKSIAEALVHEESEGKLPTLILRPSIVSGVWRDGPRGWIDGLHGLAALDAAGACGSVPYIPYSTSLILDVIPVDIVANMAIVAAAYRTTVKEKHTKVMHCASSDLNPLPLAQCNGVAQQAMLDYPMENLFGVPTAGHLVPGIETAKHCFKEAIIAPTCDSVNAYLGRKPFMVNLFAQIRELSDVMAPFVQKSFLFKSDSMVFLYDEWMHAEDRQEFNFDVRQIEWNETTYEFVVGVKHYIMKEDLTDKTRLQKARDRLRWFILADNILQFFFCFIICAVLTRSLTPWISSILLYLATLAFTATIQPHQTKFIVPHNFASRFERATRGSHDPSVSGK